MAERELNSLIEKKMIKQTKRLSLT